MVSPRMKHASAGGRRAMSWSKSAFVPGKSARRTCSKNVLPGEAYMSVFSATTQFCRSFMRRTFSSGMDISGAITQGPSILDDVWVGIKTGICRIIWIKGFLYRLQPLVIIAGDWSKPVVHLTPLAIHGS